MCFSPCSNESYQEFSIPSTQLKCWLNQPCAEYLRHQDDYGNFYPKALYYICGRTTCLSSDSLIACEMERGHNVSRSWWSFTLLHICLWWYLDPRCPGDQVFTNCGSSCPTTCANKDEDRICTLECRVGKLACIYSHGICRIHLWLACNCSDSHLKYLNGKL